MFGKRGSLAAGVGRRKPRLRSDTSASINHWPLLRNARLLCSPVEPLDIGRSVLGTEMDSRVGVREHAACSEPHVLLGRLRGLFAAREESDLTHLRGEGFKHRDRDLGIMGRLHAANCVPALKYYRPIYLFISVN